MNFLALLLGAAAVKGISSATGYPKEINEMARQIPGTERDAVLKHYKSLPGQSKDDFKKALRNADLTAASQILGEDLSRYNISFKAKTGVEASANSEEMPPDSTVQYDFAARINKILAVPTSIDPELVAEAAKRYEEAVPTSSKMGIDEKTKRLLSVSG